MRRLKKHCKAMCDKENNMSQKTIRAGKNTCWPWKQYMQETINMLKLTNQWKKGKNNAMLSNKKLRKTIWARIQTGKTIHAKTEKPL